MEPIDEPLVCQLARIARLLTVIAWLGAALLAAQLLAVVVLAAKG